MDTVEKELSSRKSEIIKELKFLFRTNMRITDWDIPEADNQKAAALLANILQEGVDEIKKEIEDNRFNYND